jgi:hypothetical protein
VYIGGEHEDSYDPDSCIYNDVVVFGPKDRIEVYGYPKEIFLPIDFLTASVFGNRIIIVAGLGYPDARRVGHTPVYELDLSGFRIAQIKTSGRCQAGSSSTVRNSNREVLTSSGAEN